MGKKQKKIVQRQVFEKRNEEQEDEFSPFKDIVLKEKTDEPSKPSMSRREVQKKRPAEIVQGYNPNASFADILSSFERTGNPYSLPGRKSGKKTEEKEGKVDFGAILDLWEGGSRKAKAKASGKIQKSSYAPTRSFAEIFSQYENVPVSTFEKKEDSPIKEKKKAVEENPVRERKESKVEIKRSFAEIYSEFENTPLDGRGGKEAKQQVKPDGQDKISGDEHKEEILPVKKAEEEVGTVSLFRKKDEDEERNPNASWSVFGDNESFVRPVVENPEDKVEDITELRQERRISEPYRPKKDFSEILSSYYDPEENVKKEDTSLETEKSVEAVASSERIVRNYDKTNLPPIRQEDRKSYKKKEEKKLEPLQKSFEEILQEKGDAAPRARDYTISQLRTMMPQSTLDLHGYKAEEAQVAVMDFLEECHRNGIRKISIITGKGLHSEGGVPVVRNLISTILDSSGYVSEKMKAPFNYGGSGAFWIILKK